MDRVELSKCMNTLNTHMGLYGNFTEKPHKQIQNSNIANVIHPLPVCLPSRSTTDMHQTREVTVVTVRNNILHLKMCIERRNYFYLKTYS